MELLQRQQPKRVAHEDGHTTVARTSLDFSLQALHSEHIGSKAQIGFCPIDEGNIVSVDGTEIAVAPTSTSSGLVAPNSSSAAASTGGALGVNMPTR